VNWSRGTARQAPSYSLPLGLSVVRRLARNDEGKYRISPYLRSISVIWDFGARNTKKKKRNPLATCAPTTCVPRCFILILTARLPLAHLGVLYLPPTCVLTRVWFSPGLTFLQKLQVHTRFPRSSNPRATCAQPAPGRAAPSPAPGAATASSVSPSRSPSISTTVVGSKVFSFYEPFRLKCDDFRFRSPVHFDKFRNSEPKSLGSSST